MSIKANADKMHDVRMTELGHYSCLHQEVGLGLAGRQFR